MFEIPPIDTNTDNQTQALERKQAITDMLVDLMIETAGNEETKTDFQIMKNYTEVTRAVQDLVDSAVEVTHTRIIPMSVETKKLVRNYLRRLTEEIKQYHTELTRSL